MSDDQFYRTPWVSREAVVHLAFGFFLVFIIKEILLRYYPYPTFNHGASGIHIDPRNARRCADRPLFGRVLGEMASFKRA